VLGGARERGLRARRSVVLTRRRWQTPADLHDAGRIEPVRGFVQDQELRLAKESERECQALPHSGRETAHAAPDDIGKPDPGQRAPLRIRRGPSANPAVTPKTRRFSAAERYG
jgi:hypothetical protein